MSDQCQGPLRVTGWKLGLSFPPDNPFIFQSRAPVTERCRSLQVHMSMAVTEPGWSYTVPGRLSEARTGVGWPDTLHDGLFHHPIPQLQTLASALAICPGMLILSPSRNCGNSPGEGLSGAKHQQQQQPTLCTPHSPCLCLFLPVAVPICPSSWSSSDGCWASLPPLYRHSEWAYLG